MITFEQFLSENEYHGYVDTSPERWKSKTADDHRELARAFKAKAKTAAKSSSDEDDRHEANAKFHTKMASIK